MSSDKILAPEAVGSTQLPPEANPDKGSSLVSDTKRPNLGSELLRRYQDLTQLKTPQRWKALNIPFRDVIVAPTEAATGA